ncbi:MAG: VOC family protein [Dehalococcoidia bacterium]|nr:VOC family protein [Dehalococcoidia bacterium]
MTADVPEPAIAQLAMSVPDMARALRFAVDGLGFRSAGGRYAAGERVSAIQGLPDVACCMWWLIGSQPFVQLELFQYASPPPAARPDNWRPSDVGYTRLTVAVPDLAATLGRLAAAGLTVESPIILGGAARACVADPSGTLVELIEDPALRGGRPALRAVGATVPALQPAVAFFRDTLGLSEVPPTTLHPPEAEALFGLPDAGRQLVALRGGDVLLELACYEQPPSRPRRPGWCLNDVGLLNVALGYRDWEEFRAAYDRVLAAGHRAETEPLGPGGVFDVAYCTGPDGFSVELLYVPLSSDAALGFVAEEDQMARPPARRR